MSDGAGNGHRTAPPEPEKATLGSSFGAPSSVQRQQPVTSTNITAAIQQNMDVMQQQLNLLQQPSTPLVAADGTGGNMMSMMNSMMGMMRNIMEMQQKLAQSQQLTTTQALAPANVDAESGQDQQPSVESVSRAEQAIATGGDEGSSPPGLPPDQHTAAGTARKRSLDSPLRDEVEPPPEKVARWSLDSPPPSDDSPVPPAEPSTDASLGAAPERPVDFSTSATERSAAAAATATEEVSTSLSALAPRLLADDGQSCGDSEGEFQPDFGNVPPKIQTLIELSFEHDPDLPGDLWADWKQQEHHHHRHGDDDLSWSTSVVSDLLFDAISVVVCVVDGADALLYDRYVDTDGVRTDGSTWRRGARSHHHDEELICHVVDSMLDLLERVCPPDESIPAASIDPERLLVSPTRHGGSMFAERLAGVVPEIQREVLSWFSSGVRVGSSTDVGNSWLLETYQRMLQSVSTPAVRKEDLSAGERSDSASRQAVEHRPQMVMVPSQFGGAPRPEVLIRHDHRFPARFRFRGGYRPPFHPGFIPGQNQASSVPRAPRGFHNRVGDGRPSHGDRMIRPLQRPSGNFPGPRLPPFRPVMEIGPRGPRLRPDVEPRLPFRPHGPDSSLRPPGHPAPDGMMRPAPADGLPRHALSDHGSRHGLLDDSSRFGPAESLVRHEPPNAMARHELIEGGGISRPHRQPTFHPEQRPLSGSAKLRLDSPLLREAELLRRALDTPDSLAPEQFDRYLGKLDELETELAALRRVQGDSTSTPPPPSHQRGLQRHDLRYGVQHDRLTEDSHLHGDIDERQFGAERHHESKHGSYATSQLQRPAFPHNDARQPQPPAKHVGSSYQSHSSPRHPSPYRGHSSPQHRPPPFQPPGPGASHHAQQQRAPFPPKGGGGGGGSGGGGSFRHDSLRHIRPYFPPRQPSPQHHPSATAANRAQPPPARRSSPQHRPRFPAQSESHYPDRLSASLPQTRLELAMAGGRRASADESLGLRSKPSRWNTFSEMEHPTEFDLQQNTKQDHRDSHTRPDGTCPPSALDRSSSWGQPQTSRAGRPSGDYRHPTPPAASHQQQPHRSLQDRPTAVQFHSDQSHSKGRSSSCRFAIYGIPPGTAASDLKEICSHHGKVTNVKLAKSAKSQFLFAYVTMETAHDVLQTMAGVDGLLLRGSLLQVKKLRDSGSSSEKKSRCQPNTELDPYSANQWI